RSLPNDKRIGVGVVNQKLDTVEPVERIEARIRTAQALLGKERVWLTPDCGFATFADNPISSAEIAEQKLAASAAAAARCSWPAWTPPASQSQRGYEHAYSTVAKLMISVVIATSGNLQRAPAGGSFEICEGGIHSSPIGAIWAMIEHVRLRGAKAANASW